MESLFSLRRKAQRRKGNAKSAKGEARLVDAGGAERQGYGCGESNFSMGVAMSWGALGSPAAGPYQRLPPKVVM